MQKKKQLRDEQFQGIAVPLNVQIEQKPDVQEIPGFQTEEILHLLFELLGKIKLEDSCFLSSYYLNRISEI